MIRNYYYRVSYHDDNQSAGSLLKQPTRDKSAVVSSLGPRWRNTVTENIMVMMTAKLTKQPRNSRHRNEDDLRRLEQCHEQSQWVLGAVRKASR